MKFTRIVKNLCETKENSKSEQNKKAQKDKTEKSAKKRQQTASAFFTHEDNFKLRASKNFGNPKFKNI